ncbi:MAG: MarR family winged helix-turn-helix transcriptional regulator [Anaerolineae bacterium]
MTLTPPATPDDRRARVKTLHKQIFTLIWFAFKRFVHRLQEYGLTQPQFVTLAALVAHGKPATMRQITAVTFQDPPTMTRVVNRLVKMNLVRRTRSEADRRVVWVEATSEGAALVYAIEHDMEQDDPYGFSVMPQNELARMEDIFEYILSRYVDKLSPPETATIAEARAQLSSFANDPLAFIKKQME